MARDNIFLDIDMRFSFEDLTRGSKGGRKIQSIGGPDAKLDYERT